MKGEDVLSFFNVTENYMKWSVVTLQLLLIYPTDPKRGVLFRLLKLFIRCSFLFSTATVAICSFIDIFAREEFIFMDIVSNITHGGLAFISFVRISYFYYNEEKLREIVDGMDTIFKENSGTGIVEKNMCYVKKFVSFLCVGGAIFFFFTAEFTVIVPILHKTGRTLPFSLWLPYDFTSDHYYIPTYLFTVYTQYAVGLSFGIPDVFFISSTYLSACQFDIISWEFENLVFTALLDYGIAQSTVEAFRDTFNNCTEDAIKTTEEFYDLITLIRSDCFEPVLRRTFLNCIRNHQRMLYYCDLLCGFLGEFMLLFIAFSFLYIIFIPLTVVYTPVMSKRFGLMEYFITALCQVLYWTLSAHLLTTSSESIKDSLYNCPWYFCSNKFRNDFRFAHVRASQPVVIRVGSYFNIDLELFINLCRTASSYFIFLRQVTELEENN